MLVLSRKPHEQIVAGDVTITVCRISGGQVRLGIEAPRHIPIVRAEKIPGPEADRQRTELDLQPAA